MESTPFSRLTLISLASTVILAISFFLPFTADITWLKPDGTPAGLFGQWSHTPDTAHITTYVHLWQNMVWIIPFVFFLPLILNVIALTIHKQLYYRWLVFIEPFIALGVLFSVFALFTMAAFTIIPGTARRAYGSYVALGAGLVLFVMTLIKVYLWVRINRNK